MLPGIVVAVVVCGVNTVLQMWGAYGWYEWEDLDRLLRSSSAQTAARTLIVEINDADFANAELFGGTRPLRSSTIVRLVAAACTLGPRVVGVDVLTDHWTPADRQALRAIALPSTCPVVWARDGDVVADAADERELYYRLRLVGDGADARDRMCMGLVALKPDDDGVLRRSSPQVWAVAPGRPDTKRSLYTTFVRAVAEVQGGRPPHACDFEAAPGSLPVPDRIRYSFGASFIRVPSRTLLDAAFGPNRDQLQNNLKSVLGNTPTVLIGATFRDARDSHVTPIGPLSGIEVMAHAVASSRSGRPIRDVPAWQSLAIDALVGSGVVLIVALLRLRVPWGTLLSLVLSFAGSLAICYFLFDNFGRFLSVFASMAGAVLGAVVDMTWQPMMRDLRAFIAEYRRLAER